jgi:hypothetical protein
MAHAIAVTCTASKNLVFGTVLSAVLSASAMGFCMICNMRLSNELVFFFIPALARVCPCRRTFILVVGHHLTRADLE